MHSTTGVNGPFNAWGEYTSLKSSTDLLCAVENREVDPVSQLLFYYIELKRSRADADGGILQKSFARSVELLSHDPLQVEIVSLFLKMLPREFFEENNWSILENALIWSIQAGENKFFKDLISVKYLDSSYLTSSNLFFLTQTIGKSGVPLDRKKELFAALPFTSYTIGRALQEAISAMDVVAVSILSNGEIDLEDRIEAVKSLIPLNWITAVKQLVLSVYIEPDVIGEFLRTAVKAERPESIAFFLEQPGITKYFVEELVAAHNDENKLHLLGKAANPSLIEETIIDLVDRRQFTLLNLLIDKEYFPANFDVSVIAQQVIPRNIEKAIEDGNLSMFQKCLEMKSKVFPLENAFRLAVLGSNLAILDALLERHGKEVSEAERIKGIEKALEGNRLWSLRSLLEEKWFIKQLPLEETSLQEKVIKRAIDCGHLYLFMVCFDLNSFPLSDAFGWAVLGPNGELLSALLSRYGGAISEVQRVEGIRLAITHKNAESLGFLLDDKWFCSPLNLEQTTILQEALELAIELGEFDLFASSLQLKSGFFSLEETVPKVILSANLEILCALLEKHGKEVSEQERVGGLKLALAEGLPGPLQILLDDRWFGSPFNVEKRTDLEEPLELALKGGEFSLLKSCLGLSHAVFPLQGALRAAILGKDLERTVELLSSHGKEITEIQRKELIKLAIRKDFLGSIKDILDTVSPQNNPST
jgi:hypothetical protein